jgi:hypothetical protein
MSFNSCKGCLGRWLIYETMPRYLPPNVRYKVNGSSWQVVSPANNYKITPVFDPTKQYDVTFSGETTSGICYYYNNGIKIYNTLRLFGNFELWSGNFIPEYNWIGKQWALKINGEIWAPNFLSYNGYGQVWQVVQGCNLYPISGWFYGLNPPKIENVVPVGDATINYKLEIFNNTTLVFEQIFNNKPVAEILPASCKYFNEDKKLVNIYYNNNPNNFMSLSTIGNTSIVWLLNDWSNLLPPRPEPFYILYKGTSDCDLPPKIDTECMPECIKCPNGTCAVPCGNVICCYNNDGISVLSIPKERYCNG